MVDLSDIQLYILKHLIAYTEEIGMDERFLKLLFFDVSQLGKAASCDYMFPVVDFNNLRVEYTCEFILRPLFISGYILMGYQVLVLCLAPFLKPHKSSISLTGDFMLVLEETSMILLVVVGSTFGFYLDLILISASIYIVTYKRRVALESHI